MRHGQAQVMTVTAIGLQHRSLMWARLEQKVTG
jgi:hypothetical protein